MEGFLTEMWASTSWEARFYQEVGLGCHWAMALDGIVWAPGFAYASPLSEAGHCRALKAGVNEMCIEHMCRSSLHSVSVDSYHAFKLYDLGGRVIGQSQQCEQVSDSQAPWWQRTDCLVVSTKAFTMYKTSISTKPLADDMTVSYCLDHTLLGCRKTKSSGAGLTLYHAVTQERHTRSWGWRCWGCCVLGYSKLYRHGWVRKTTASQHLRHFRVEKTPTMSESTPVGGMMGHFSRPQYWDKISSSEH